MNVKTRYSIGNDNVYDEMANFYVKSFGYYSRLIVLMADTHSFFASKG